MRKIKLFSFFLALTTLSGCSESPSVVEYSNPVVIISTAEETSSIQTTETITAEADTSEIDITIYATELETTEPDTEEATEMVESTTEESSAVAETTPESTAEPASSEEIVIPSHSEEPTTESATTQEATTAATATSLKASVSGSHFIGDSLTGGDFTIEVGYSDGSSVINPPNWSAYPLLLSGESNIITVDYAGLTTQVTVSASERPTVPPPTIPQVNPGDMKVYTVSYGGIMYVQGDGPCVCIDPGHMGHGSPALEPNGPGSGVMKARATTGTAGVATRIAESIVNLQVSLQLRDALLAQGYNVMMTRESQDVDISNMERSIMANDNGATIIVRIHCNSVDNQSVTGSLTMSPSAANPYPNVRNNYNQSYNLSALIVNHVSAATGFVNRGIMTTDTMTGINWANVPVTILEMGFMSNPDEDRKLCDPGYQKLIVGGVVNGINAYFGR